MQRISALLYLDSHFLMKNMASIAGLDREQLVEVNIWLLELTCFLLHEQLFVAKLSCSSCNCSTADRGHIAFQLCSTWQQQWQLHYYDSNVIHLSIFRLTKSSLFCRICSQRGEREEQARTGETDEVKIEERRGEREHALSLRVSSQQQRWPASVPVLKATIKALTHFLCLSCQITLQKSRTL